jgi:hypothetical protein
VTKWKIGHVGKEPHALGARREVSDESEGVEESPLIRVILDADEIQPGLIGTRTCSTIS